ncbi:MAG: hypothetical protein ACOCUA_01800 [archaeon]
MTAILVVPGVLQRGQCGDRGAPAGSIALAAPSSTGRAFESRREPQMAVQQQRVGVDADLTVHVPRNDHGTLEEGVEERVRRVDGVERLERVELTAVRPRLNDMAVGVRVEVVLATDDADPPDVAAVLDEGFGVTVEEVVRHG